MADTTLSTSVAVKTHNPKALLIYLFPVVVNVLHQIICRWGYKRTLT
jgi:hypothetical protein